MVRVANRRSSVFADEILPRILTLAVAPGTPSCSALPEISAKGGGGHSTSTVDELATAACATTYAVWAPHVRGWKRTRAT